MMNPSAHLSPEVIERWRSRQLSPAEILAASDHLAQCPTCASAAQSHSADAVAIAVKRVLEQDELDQVHLTAEQLEIWVDGSADPVESEIVTSHLAVCDSCRADADDLRRFAATLPVAVASRRWTSWLIAAALSGLALGLAVYLVATKTRPPVVVSEPVPVPPAVVGVPMPSPEPAAGTELHDGELTITLRPDGSVDGLPKAWREEIAGLLRKPELTVPAAALALVRGTEVQRSDASGRGPGVRLAEPMSRMLLDPRPTFRWTGPADAEYRVEVYSASFERVAASDRLAASSWQPRSSLPRGEPLTWKVTEFRGGTETGHPAPPQPPAVFQIVSAEVERDLDAAKSLGSHLISGLALWRAGLLSEAAEEFAAWAAQNPENDVAQTLFAASARGAASLREAR